MISTHGMHTNIGVSSLRMPSIWSVVNINAVVISPQKAMRAVFLGFIFLRSLSDSTFIEFGFKSTTTAHIAIIPARNSIVLWFSIVVAKTLLSLLCYMALLNDYSVDNAVA